MADFCVMRTSEADITVNGDIRIDANNVGIATESTELYDGSFTLAQGIYGRHRGTGDVDITARGGFITTKGRSSYGMRGDHGHRITTTGANAHGIVAYHYFGTEDDRSIDVTVGGRIDTSGATGLPDFEQARPAQDRRRHARLFPARRARLRVRSG